MYNFIFYLTNNFHLFFREQKHWFNNKHKIYCLKNEVSILPSGQAVNWSTGFPGSIHDFSIFMDNIYFHVNAIRKNARELQEDDSTTYHANLLDKGYK